MKIWEPFEDGYICGNIGLFSFNCAWWVHTRIPETDDYVCVEPRLFVIYSPRPEIDRHPQKSEALEIAKRVAENYMQELEGKNETVETNK